MMILLSVIVPIFNTPNELLKRCLFSLTNIGIKEYEVLLVDDGSDSYVEEICAQYTRSDNRFKYLKKLNGGVSSARNYGIERSLGSYITFVDSDDEIIAGSITVSDFSSQSDLIFFNKTLYKEGEKKIRKEIGGPSRYVSVEDIFEAMILLNRFHGPMARLYKSSILRKAGLCFDVNMMQGEDAVFNINYLKKCETIYYIDKSVYSYHMVSTTLRNRWKKDSQKMLDNFWYLYIKKSELTDRCEDIDKKNMLLFRLNSNTEYLLFQSCLDMIQIHAFHKGIQKKCVEFSKRISNSHKLDTKGKVISYMIEHESWSCLKVIGTAREFYLSKIKKTWE